SLPSRIPPDDVNSAESLDSVRRAGLEPARCYPLAPQASASANSATFAWGRACLPPCSFRVKRSQLGSWFLLLAQGREDLAELERLADQLDVLRRDGVRQAVGAPRDEHEVDAGRARPE